MVATDNFTKTKKRKSAKGGVQARETAKSGDLRRLEAIKTSTCSTPHDRIFPFFCVLSFHSGRVLVKHDVLASRQPFQCRITPLHTAKYRRSSAGASVVSLNSFASRQQVRTVSVCWTGQRDALVLQSQRLLRQELIAPQPTSSRRGESRASNRQACTI